MLISKDSRPSGLSHPDPALGTMIRGRYAPSPTGRLHLGNLRTALVAWLQTRLSGGQFVLRIDDLDTLRIRPGSLESIYEDLRWIGIDWDEGPDAGGPYAPYRQSERLDHYREFFLELQNRNLVYRCYCSRKDIASAQSAPHTSDASPVYPGTCRQGYMGTASSVESGEHAWRFLVGIRSTRFNDEVLGPQGLQLDTGIGDFVVLRKDRQFAYQLACATDDFLMATTDVVRGADLVDSTHRQIAILDALGLSPPRYWHIPLMEDENGERMSKRDGSDSLTEWRNKGHTAADLVGLFASSLGLIDGKEPVSALELLQQLDRNSFHDRLAPQS